MAEHGAGAPPGLRPELLGASQPGAEAPDEEAEQDDGSPGSGSPARRPRGGRGRGGRGPRRSRRGHRDGQGGCRAAADGEAPATVEGVILDEQPAGSGGASAGGERASVEGIILEPGAAAAAGPSQGRGSRASGRRLPRGAAPDDIEEWAEYEGVLATCELNMVDVVDRWCRKCCPFKRCALHWNEKQKAAQQRQRRQDAEATFPPTGGPRRGYAAHVWWEGVSDKVPERYQRWEGIRERNTILSLAFGLFGYGRKQPTRWERVHLFLLYAAVWYMCYAIMLRRGSHACHRTWVEACAPVAVGGGCSTDCAADELLAQTPEGFPDFSELRSRTSFDVLHSDVKCLESGAAASMCEMPMCAPVGEKPCLFDGGAVGGLCYCEDPLVLMFFSTLLYTVLFKLLYYPVWILLGLDLDALCCNCKTAARLSTMIVFLFYSVLVLSAALMIERYTGSASGLGSETLKWFGTFVVLCLFEVVKAFSLGYVAGAYVVYPLFGPCVARLWKFALA